MNLPFFTSSSFSGTAKELVDKGVKVNGRMIDQVTLSIFHRHGLVQEIGVAAKEQHTRGRAAKIFKIESSKGFEVTV